MFGVSHRGEGIGDADPSDGTEETVRGSRPRSAISFANTNWFWLQADLQTALEKIDHWLGRTSTERLRR